MERGDHGKLRFGTKREGIVELGFFFFQSREKATGERETERGEIRVRERVWAL